jgi:hypothetical protein
LPTGNTLRTAAKCVRLPSISSPVCIINQSNHQQQYQWLL